MYTFLGVMSLRNLFISSASAFLKAGEKGHAKALYNYRKDWFLKQNLLGKTGKTEQQMERELKAIIQSYMERMVEDRLTVNNE